MAVKVGPDQYLDALVGDGYTPSNTNMNNATAEFVINTPNIGGGDDHLRHCAAWEQVKPAFLATADCLEKLCYMIAAVEAIALAAAAAAAKAQATADAAAAAAAQAQATADAAAAAAAQPKPMMAAFSITTEESPNTAVAIQDNLTAFTYEASTYSVTGECCTAELALIRTNAETCKMEKNHGE